MENNKPKIAVIGLKGLPAFGGAAAVGENIIKQLKDKYDFTVYSVSSHTDLNTGNNDGYKQIVFRKFFWIKINTLYYYILSLFHTVIRGDYDFIHLHHNDAAFIIPLLRLRYPVMVTTHGAHNTVKLSKWKGFHWYFNLQNYFIKFANIVCCVSMEEKLWLKSNFNVKANYIPNGINIEQLLFKKNKINYKNYIFFSAGRIIESKGCHLLLNALHKINYQGLILIAGSTDHSPVYSKSLFKLAKGLNVNFIGLIKDKNILNTYLRNALLFVYPSFLESMSMMLLEAASMKAPIICSDIPENKAVFNDNDVLFFKSQDSNDLALKIQNVLDHPIKMNSRRENAFKKLKDVYNWELIAKKYDHIYQKLLLE